MGTPQPNQRARRTAEREELPVRSHPALILSLALATGTAVLKPRPDRPGALKLSVAEGKEASPELRRMVDAHLAGIQEILSTPDVWTAGMMFQSS